MLDDNMKMAKMGDTVTAVAQETGAGFLDLTPMLVEHADPASLYLAWIGTWRPETYQLAAQLVAQKLAALGWIGEVPRHEQTAGGAH